MSADTLAYVGASACASCHETEYRLWEGSDHELAMATATEESVLADFDGTIFTECGVETTFFRDANRFLVRTQGPRGRLDTFEVAYTFGYRPLQQYLIAFDDGRVQALTIAWDTGERRWFSLYPDECIPPDDWLHWTQPGMNWNYMCADCHSTNLHRNFVVTSNTYQTTFSEINVSCEACHGPGEAHVAWAQRGSGAGGYADANYGLTAALARDRPASNELDVCAPCHSRRRIVFPNYLPGRPFLDHFEPSLLEEDLYYADGQIQDEVFEYGSFQQSKMYAAGVRCSDCHDPHSSRVVAEGNALCASCHVPAVYDTSDHHHHEQGTEAAQCVACHMASRDYMVVDPRRDHRFNVPRPDLSVRLGIPNACSGCHQDASPRWAAERAREWYGPPSSTETIAAGAIASGRAGEAGADSALASIATDGAYPPFLRASALQLAGDYSTPESYRASLSGAYDGHPLVQTIAIRNLEDRMPPERLVEHITPLLTSESRLVRMEAARVLARTAADRFAGDRGGEPARVAFWSALTEYREGQHALSDQAAAHLNLAIIHEGVGELEQAEEAYRLAIRLDSSFIPAHANLAMLYNRRRIEASAPGGSEEADRYFDASEGQLRRALEIEPDQPEILYSLGLLLAERPERLEEAAAALQRAADLAPAQSRIQYNTGLALQQLGRADAAVSYLKRALNQEPDQPDYLNALSVLYIQMERWEEARDYTERLAELLPPNAPLEQRLAYIRRRAEEQ